MEATTKVPANSKRFRSRIEPEKCRKYAITLKFERFDSKNLKFKSETHAQTQIKERTNE